MNSTDWREIPRKLKEAGFNFSYEPVCYDPVPLWRAKAHRDEHEWSATGACICEAFVALEKELGTSSEH